MEDGLSRDRLDRRMIDRESWWVAADQQMNMIVGA
jgi:hypothetical protein